MQARERAAAADTRAISAEESRAGGHARALDVIRRCLEMFVHVAADRGRAAALASAAAAEDAAAAAEVRVRTLSQQVRVTGCVREGLPGAAALRSMMSLRRCKRHVRPPQRRRPRRRRPRGTSEGVREGGVVWERVEPMCRRWKFRIPLGRGLKWSAAVTTSACAGWREMSAYRCHGWWRA